MKMGLEAKRKCNRGWGPTKENVRFWSFRRSERSPVLNSGQTPRYFLIISTCCRAFAIASAVAAAAAAAAVVAAHFTLRLLPSNWQIDGCHLGHLPITPLPCWWPVSIGGCPLDWTGDGQTFHENGPQWSRKSIELVGVNLATPIWLVSFVWHGHADERSSAATFHPSQLAHCKSIDTIKMLNKQTKHEVGDFLSRSRLAVLQCFHSGAALPKFTKLARNSTANCKIERC